GIDQLFAQVRCKPLLEEPAHPGNVEECMFDVVDGRAIHGGGSSSFSPRVSARIVIRQLLPADRNYQPHGKRPTPLMVSLSNHAPHHPRHIPAVHSAINVRCYPRASTGSA